MGASFSHFFKEDWDAAKDVLKGIGSGIGDVFKGVTSGKWNFSDAGRDFSNYGHDIANSFTGGSTRDHAPIDETKVARDNLNRAINPNSKWNQVNWKSVSRSITGTRYGQATGVGSVTPPSNIMTISDPNTKMNISGTRGRARSAMHLAGAALDASHADTFAALNGTAAMSSNINNSAGATGHTTSMDANNDQFQ